MAAHASHCSSIHLFAWPIGGCVLAHSHRHTHTHSWLASTFCYCCSLAVAASLSLPLEIQQAPTPTVASSLTPTERPFECIGTQKIWTLLIARKPAFTFVTKSPPEKKTSLEIWKLNNLLCDSGEYCPKLISTAESTRKCRILEKRMISKLINFAPLHGNCVRSCVRVREWVPWHTLLTCQKFPHFSLANKGIATKIPQKVAKKYVTKFPLFICVLSPVMN